MKRTDFFKWSPPPFDVNPSFFVTFVKNNMTVRFLVYFYNFLTL